MIALIAYGVARRGWNLCYPPTFYENLHMKDEERITNHPEGFSVKNDWDKINKIRDIVDLELSKHKFMTIDCLTALCILAIETAYNGNVDKPQFLAKISQWWEEMDNQVND